MNKRMLNDNTDLPNSNELSLEENKLRLIQAYMPHYVPVFKNYAKLFQQEFPML
jgi:hypothetical protein